jgi:hypothetical protein
MCWILLNSGSLVVNQRHLPARHDIQRFIKESDLDLEAKDMDSSARVPNVERIA